MLFVDFGFTKKNGSTDFKIYCLDSATDCCKTNGFELSHFSSLHKLKERVDCCREKKTQFCNFIPPQHFYRFNLLVK